MNQSSYTVTVELDETGEHVIDLPPELLNSLEWDENTDLEWVVENDTIFVRKAEHREDLDEDDTRVTGYATLGVLVAATVVAASLVAWVLYGSI